MWILLYWIYWFYVQRKDFDRIYKSFFTKKFWEEWWHNFVCKINKSSSTEAIDKTILSEQTKFRVSEIIGIENYFYQEIDQIKSYSKKLNKHVAAFDYIDKILIFLSAKSGGVSII